VAPASERGGLGECAAGCGAGAALSAALVAPLLALSDGVWNRCSCAGCSSGPTSRAQWRSGTRPFRTSPVAFALPAPRRQLPALPRSSASASCTSPLLGVSLLHFPAPGRKPAIVSAACPASVSMSTAALPCLGVSIARLFSSALASHCVEPFSALLPALASRTSLSRRQHRIVRISAPSFAFSDTVCALPPIRLFRQ
jgi:hypothetical protein